MRVVLDTNVILSSTLSQSGPPAEIIRRWYNREFEVALSSPLLAEIARTFTYPRIQKSLKLSPEELERFLQTLRSSTILVEPTVTLQVIEDEPDNRVLECAVAAQADYIVSGNTRHLVALQTYEGIAIVTPATFLAILQLPQS